MKRERSLGGFHLVEEEFERRSVSLLEALTLSRVSMHDASEFIWNNIR